MNLQIKHQYVDLKKLQGFREILIPISNKCMISKLIYKIYKRLDVRS